MGGVTIKQLNRVLNCIIGAFIGVFIGQCIWQYGDVCRNPEFYAVTSAPWYISIIFYAVVTVVIIAIVLAVKLFINKYFK